MLALLLAPGSVRAQARVSGTIIDRDSGTALRGATIVVADTIAPFTTGEDGRFVFAGLPVGEYEMHFRHPGYADRVETLRVMRPGEIDLRVDLMRSPYELEPIEVTAERSPFLARQGFYARQELGISGTFLDRKEIERRDPKFFTDLFQQIPGAKVRSGSTGRKLVRFARTTGMRGSHPDGCVPDMYIDGLITGGRPGASTLEDHDLVEPRHVEAVEVYVGAATPIQYKNDCGVILVWLRHR